jgi:hypothetical protein
MRTGHSLQALGSKKDFGLSKLVILRTLSVCLNQTFALFKKGNYFGQMAIMPDKRQ